MLSFPYQDDGSLRLLSESTTANKSILIGDNTGS